MTVAVGFSGLDGYLAVNAATLAAIFCATSILDRDLKEHSLTLMR
jgi:hypothetical protein